MSADAKKRILIVANELSPYVEDTIFAPILNALSRKTFDSGMEIRVIMPRFGTINERRHRLHEVVRLSGINIIVDKDDYPLVIKVASLPNARLQVYFMDNEDFFKRKFTARDEEGRFYEDNTERMVFFCKSALETVKKFGWPPHLIHCHGWMTSLLPVYLKTAYKKEPVFAHSKVAYTVQNPQFPETLGADFVKKAIVNQDFKEKELDAYKAATAEALTLGAMKASDILIQGEPVLEPALEEAMKPARNKKIIRWEDDWAEDATPLLEIYKNLVDFPVKA